MMESGQSPFDIDAIINLCAEEIRRYSNGAISLSHDIYALRGACLDAGAQ